MVIFQTPGGSPGYNQFESLDDAVAFVEQLRNDREVTNARMFALEEIKFDLKPVFRVELQALNPGSSDSDESATQAPSASPAAPPPAAQPEPAPAPAPPAPSAPAPAAQPEPAPAPAPTFGAFSDQQPAPEAPEPAPGGAEPAPASTEPAPAPPAPDEQPARRGLFGR